jgi:drug resistance transporter, EmrB/QacA subfamily
LTGPTTEELVERYGSGYKWFATVSVMVGCIATVLSSTIVNVAMPDIMGEFGMGQDQVQWLSTAFLAAMTASMLSTDWMLHALGVRRAYLFSLAAFIAGSVLGGVSPGMETLVLGRVIQGAAAGLVQPVAMIVIFSVFGADRRGTAMGIYGLGVVLAPALGPTVGGLLIDNYSWRYVFFLGPPFCLVGVALSLAFLPAHEKRQAPRPFDLLGFLFLCVAIAALLAGISSGQREGWDSDYVLGAFCMSAFAWGGFIVREHSCAHPLLALGVYANPRFLAASAVAFILGMGLFGSTYLIPLFVQTVQGYSPTESGLLLMPGGLMLGVVMPVAGRIADRLPPYTLITVGLAVFGWSSLCMSNVDTSTWFWDFAGWIVLGRIGLGLILPSLNSGALRVLDERHMAQGAGAINFIRQLGGAVGVSLLSVYLEQQTELYAQAFNHLQTGIHATADTLDRVSLLLGRSGQVDDLSQALRPPQAYSYFSSMISAQARMMGFRESFLFVALVFFGAIVPAWFMRPGRRP